MNLVVREQFQGLNRLDGGPDDLELKPSQSRPLEASANTRWSSVAAVPKRFCFMLKALTVRPRSGAARGRRSSYVR